MNLKVALVFLVAFPLGALAADQPDQLESESAVGAEARRKEIESQLAAIRAARAEAQKQLKAAEQRLANLREKRGIYGRHTTRPWPRAVIDAIRANWTRPPIEDTGTQGCTAAIELAEDGEVMAISFPSPCSPAALQHSIENAIIKSSPLPLPVDPSFFRRHITAHFTPADEA